MDATGRRWRIAFAGLLAVFVLLGVWRFFAQPAAKLPVGPIPVTWALPDLPPSAAEVEEPEVLKTLTVRAHEQKEKQPAKPMRDFSKELGFVLVSGALVSGSLSGGAVRLENGVLRGVNFPELYCRAAAFAGGKPMPPAPSPREQPFETMDFFLKPDGGVSLESLRVAQDPFVLEGALATVNGALRGHLFLSLNGPWKNRCGVDENWQQIALPLRCEAPKGGTLSCALELKKLIESLTGVAAKATEVKQKAEIQKLEQDIRKEREKFFKNRVKERPVMEEHDLRPLFLP